MTPSKAQIAVRKAKLTAKIAATEVILSDLREKLAKLEGQEVTPDPETDITPLWEAAPEMARKRSSPQLCRIAWKKVPKAERPPVAVAVDAMKAWKRDPEWKKDGGQFIPALDRWIKERRWENPPEQTEAPSRARQPVKPVIQPSTDEAVTDPAEIAAILGTKPRRMNS